LCLSFSKKDENGKNVVETSPPVPLSTKWRGGGSKMHTHRGRGKKINLCYMPNFVSPELIDQIRDANDIVDLITEYVPLKKRGKNYVGLCPFHAEKAPSFSVSPDKQMFYCFGCGEGGNVISFLMKHEKLGFSDAIRHLAKRAKISLPKRSFDKKKAEQFDKLYYANRVANEYFHKNFYREAPGEKARQYLNKRGFDPEIVKQFSLGYAPDDWEGLMKFAKNKDVEMEVLNQAGLVVPRTETSGSTTLTTRGYYDRFRNRIIFPIFNLSGKVVGFGGRVLDDKDQPKYLNSPESPIYQKGKILYGLNFSKDEIRKKGSAVLVEGYVDLLSLYQAGITNVVASSGTAFTSDQARLLSRYAEGVYLLFDADTAGQSATFRSVDLLFSEGVEVFVVSLPKGEDPDSFVKKFGVKEVAKKIEQAQTFIDFKRESLPKDFEELSLKEQEKVILDLAETARKITNDLRRNLFVKKVAQAFKIDEAPIFKMMGKRTTKATFPSKKETSISPVTGQEKIEMGILRILMEDRKLMKLTEGKLKLDDFSTPEHKEIFQLLGTRSGRSRTSAFLDKTENENTKQILSRIAAMDLGTAELSIQLTDHLKTLNNLKKDRKIKTLKESIKKALQNGDTEKANLLTREFERLKKA
jgi:DNA primase